MPVFPMTKFRNGDLFVKSSFTIKSFQNGINLRLNPETPFEVLLQEIAQKFSGSRAFFGSADIALSLEGRELSSWQEMEILDVISENSDLNVICIVGKEDASQNNFIKALQTLQSKLPGGDYAQFYRGTVRDGDVLQMEDSIIILGDVNPGCVVTSSKNIIIMGGLYGEAYAGQDCKENAFVIALEMEPEALGVGNFKYGQPKKGKWRIQPKIQPKIAFLRDEEVVLEPLTKDILENI